MKPSHALLMVFALSAFMLNGCGGGGGGGGKTTTTSTEMTTTTLSSITTTTLVSGTSTIAVMDLESEATTFTVPSNAISFLLSASGDSETLIGFNALSTPSGTDLVSGDLAGLLDPSAGYGNVLVPMIPSHTATVGQWQFQAYGGFDALKVTLRTGAIPTASLLSIKPYLTGTKYTTSQVESVLAVLKDIYENAGLQVQLDAVTVISEEKFSTISSRFTDSITAELISMGAADQINLFFIEDFTGSDAGILGISSGIPGSLGIAGNYNGVLNGMDGHLINGSLDIQLLGETAAHEMGHWLGLFHTTESNGTVFDPLDDTPECPISNALFSFFGVQPSDCEELDGTNLMFWTGSETIDQSTLTPNQVHIVNYSPIAQ